ncbi:MAG: MFS transporter [Actinobacteria bacterium]|nr:MFS transporter [Actinomycetota bacterium]
MQSVHSTAVSPPPPPATSREPAHPRLVPVLVGIGFAVAIVSSLGSPMVPTVAKTYGVSMNTAQWTLTIALLAGAVSTPVLGKLGDTLHRRRTMLATLGVMTLGAVIAMIDGPFWMLLVGRALQGSGLGLVALAMATARDHLPAAKLTGALAILSVSISAGVGLGYPLSGFVAEKAGFHPTFAVAAVISGLAALAAWRVLPLGAHLPRRRIDVVGAVLMAIGLAVLVVAMSQAGTWGITSTRFVGAVLIAVVVLGLCARFELRVADPIVDLRTLRFRAVRVAHSISLIAGVGMYFMVSLIIRYVQTPDSIGYGMGHTVLFAGLILVPFSTASLIVSQVQPAIVRSVGARWTTSLGAAVFLASMVGFAAYRSSEWFFVVLLFVSGFGVSVVNASITPMIVGAIPAEDTASAMGLNAVLRSVGSSWGSAASGAVLSANTAAGSLYPTDHGYVLAALVGMAVWAVAVAIAWPRSAGATSERPTSGNATSPAETAVGFAR